MIRKGLDVLKNGKPPHLQGLLDFVTLRRVASMHVAVMIQLFTAKIDAENTCGPFWHPMFEKTFNHHIVILFQIASLFLFFLHVVQYTGTKPIDDTHMYMCLQNTLVGLVQV